MALSDTLFAAVAAHLTAELGDAATAREMAEILQNDVFSWRVPTVEPDKITTILAFTFGNRMLPTGNRLPGPVNQALADVAVRLHGQTGARIYAQWEIADAVGDRVPRERMTPINPARDARAEPLYLTTAGVVAEVVRQVGDPRSLGGVGIVAFADHAWRCVETARRFGMNAFAPSGHAMPRDYDAQSGQPWCRNRLAYLMHDITIRAGERRDRLAAQTERA